MCLALPNHLRHKGEQGVEQAEHVDGEDAGVVDSIPRAQIIEIADTSVGNDEINTLGLEYELLGVGTHSGLVLHVERCGHDRCTPCRTLCGCGHEQILPTSDEAEGHSRLGVVQGQGSTNT